jgi:TfoX/Sxy family transcriptional regulator of competence genes
MEFRKSPQKLIETFGAAMPAAPAERRLMFGYPAGFVNGNMFMGLFGDVMHLRLPDELRIELTKLGGAPFEPMPGRPMREYVVVPESLLKSSSKLASWVDKALRHTMSLPPKKKKAKPPKPAKSGVKTRR